MRVPPGEASNLNIMSRALSDGGVKQRKERVDVGAREGDGVGLEESGGECSLGDGQLGRRHDGSPAVREIVGDGRWYLDDEDGMKLCWLV